MGNGFVLFGNSPDVSQRGLNYTCLCNAWSDLRLWGSWACLGRKTRAI